MRSRSALSILREARAIARRYLDRVASAAVPVAMTGAAIASAGVRAIVRSRADVRLALIAARSSRLRERRIRRAAQAVARASDPLPPPSPGHPDRTAEALATMFLLCAYARRGSVSARVLERMVE